MPCKTLWVTLAADRRVFAKTMDETSRVVRAGGPAAKPGFVKLTGPVLAGRESYRKKLTTGRDFAPSGRTARSGGRAQHVQQRLQGVAQTRLEHLGAGREGIEAEGLVEVRRHQQDDIALLHRNLPVVAVVQAAQ